MENVWVKSRSGPGKEHPAANARELAPLTMDQPGACKTDALTEGDDAIKGTFRVKVVVRVNEGS
jgi:hypothetical protein